MGPLLFILLLLVAQASAGIEERVFETSLENGLKVLLLEEPKAPLVTVQVWYRLGSRNEVQGRTGLSHLLEHMMSKGTARYGPQQFSRIIQRYGGEDNAFTSDDSTGYVAKLPADRVELALELEADRMANLLLDPQEVETEKKVVLEERRLTTEDDPISALAEEVLAAAFKSHPYGQPTIGFASDIEGLTREDLLDHYRTYYVPNNAVLVVVGDVKTPELLARIRLHFGKIPRGPDPPKVRAREPAQQGERRVYLRKEVELPFVYMAFHVPNLTHPDSYALMVLEVLLSGGQSARLYRSLVYERQLALSAEASYERVTWDPHLFSCYASVMPGRTTEEVEKALTEEIEKLKREPISDRELQKAKNQLETAFLLGQDSILDSAEELASYEMAASWKLWGDYLAGVRSVTKDDLLRVARRYLDEDNRTVGILVPLKQKQD